MPLWQLGVAELHSGYRNRDFTPTDVLASVMQRIADVNPVLNAIVTPNEDEAIRVAEESTERWREGCPLSHLDGIFTTIKDNIPVKGKCCTWGSKAFEFHVPAKDELAVGRLRDSGAGILGKTNVPEFTLQGFTDNAIFGATANPWNLDLTPGGSSGGAVAAVASGMGVAALATDGGVSIRRPCAHVGLYGLKPSPGFVARVDHLPPLLGDFETLGVIARSPDDLGAILSCVACRDPRDRSSYAFTDRERVAELSHRGGLRILYIPAFGDFPVDPEIASSVAEAARLFGYLGHNIEIGTIPFDIERLNAIWNLVGPAGLAWLVEREGIDAGLISPSLLPMLETGRATSAAAYVQMLSDVQALRLELAEVFQRHDVILTPSIAALSWPKSETHPTKIDGIEAGPRGHAVFTPFANAGGLPGINLPTAPSSSGLPIGCQLVGPFGSDLELLSIAKTYEAAFGRYTWPEI
jgi:aspartyl-tRNA(Asn)/glutamyl-tRNA(Gln) amidotransferase subunit A